MKTNITKYKQDTVTIWTNLKDLVDATALFAVSGYAIFQSLNHLQTDKVSWYTPLLVAGVLIGLQAFVLFVRHLNRPAPVAKKK